MKHNYSRNDIKRAVEQAEAIGLDGFMSNDPRGGKKTSKNTDTRASKGHIKPIDRGPRRKIFDDLMFGSLSPKTGELMKSSSLIISSRMTSHHHHMDKTGDVLSTDDCETCDPCEEVRQIVKGIREGKYTLRTTGFEEDLDTVQPTRHPARKNIRLPKHWRSNQARPSQAFKYHKTFWDGGNMTALRMTNKES